VWLTLAYIGGANLYLLFNIRTFRSLTTAPSLYVSSDSGSVKKRHSSTFIFSSTGPKPSALLAKSLKTYRLDIYRTLGSLTEKGMVNPSLDSPTVYAAVDIKIALDAALKNFESEPHEMEMTKQELQELLNQQRLRP